MRHHQVFTEDQLLTSAVSFKVDRSGMLRSLHIGDFLRCRCRKWHPVVKWHSSGTDYTLRMLYFECKGQRFYAGQEGVESPHERGAGTK